MPILIYLSYHIQCKIISMQKSRRLLIGEEIFNSVTHGIGILLSLVGLIVLLTMSFQNQNAGKLPGLMVFEGALILSYLFSTLFHSLIFTKAKKVFKVLDHASIFLLIAGTYTPFTLLALQPTMGWVLLLLIWGLTVAGITFRSIRPNGNRIIFLTLYLTMGWLAVVTLRSFLTTFPVVGIKLLLAGGLFYTAGTVFFLWRKLPFSHGVWHLFVIAGSFCHFLAVLYLIT